MRFKKSTAFVFSPITDKMREDYTRSKHRVFGVSFIFNPKEQEFFKIRFRDYELCFLKWTTGEMVIRGSHYWRGIHMIESVGLLSEKILFNLIF